MPRKWRAVDTSLCAPGTALADTGSGRGATGTLVHQVQRATNETKTEQTATSEASSKHVNTNVPVELLSRVANQGDLHQSNDTETLPASQNNSQTTQGNLQNHEASATGPKGREEYGSCGCQGNTGDGGQKVSQSQTASNSNSTSQSGESAATTEQENINALVHMRLGAVPCCIRP